MLREHELHSQHITEIYVASFGIILNELVQITNTQEIILFLMKIFDTGF